MSHEWSSSPVGNDEIEWDAITAHVIPDQDSTYDLGDTVTPKRWRAVYADTLDAPTIANVTTAELAAITGCNTAAIAAITGCNTAAIGALTGVTTASIGAITDCTTAAIGALTGVTTAAIASITGVTGSIQNSAGPIKFGAGSPATHTSANDVFMSQDCEIGGAIKVVGAAAIAAVTINSSLINTSAAGLHDWRATSTSSGTYLRLLTMAQSGSTEAALMLGYGTAQTSGDMLAIRLVNSVAVQVGGWGCADQAKPAAAADYRSVYWPLQGGAGVADAPANCLKDSADAYNWIPGIDGDGNLALSGIMTGANRFNVQTLDNESGTLALTSTVVHFINVTSSYTLTLPLAASYGAGFLVVHDKDGTTGGGDQITIAANAADSVEGGASVVINTSSFLRMYYCDGTNDWHQIA